MENFGRLLRNFRLNCKDPNNFEWRLSQERLGDLLGKEMGGGGFSGAAISDWERGVSKIHADHRPVLVGIIKVLKQYGGIVDQTEANMLLNAGNYRSLDQQEIASLFPKNLSVETSPRNENHQSPKLWPPSIPDEDYYLLPHREQQVVKLLELLKGDQAPQVISIDGLGGLGKTSIAAELARRSVEKGLFEGVIGETAKQEILSENGIILLDATILNYESLLDTLARQLQLWEIFTMEGKSKEILLSQALRQSRYLVLVDNLETIENANILVAHLRNILGTSRAIVTTRVKVHFGFAHSHTLESLSLEDSLQFIHSTAEELGITQIQHINRKMAMEMYQLTGGSPLAIKLAVAQARYLDLDYILNQMRGVNTNLYFFIFKESWAQLSPSAQNILVYIGKTAIETVSLQELFNAELAESEEDAAKAIDQLIAFSLINVSYAGKQIRYGVHQLTRQFIIKDLPEIWKQQGLL